MKRKVLYGIMSALLIAVCAFALTACSSPQEKELRSIGDERATQIVCYSATVEKVQTLTTYTIDGDKLRITEEKVDRNTVSGRVTEFTDSIFWMDGETLRCIERYVKTNLESIQNQSEYRQSYNNIFTNDSKFAVSEKTGEELKEIYDKAIAMFDVSGAAIGKEIDADKELYKDKGFSFTTSNGVNNAGDIVERINEDGSKKTVKEWSLENKRLKSKFLNTESLEYQYDYETHTVSVPARFTQSN